MPKRGPLLNPDDPQQRFALELRKLRLHAGNPSLMELARKMSCSHSTVSAYLNGRRLPPPDQLRGLIRACSGDPAVWQRELERVHEHLNRLPLQVALEDPEVEPQGIRGDAPPGDAPLRSSARQSNPLLQRRRLAAELRQIRERKEESGAAVAAALKWPPSRISRYERGRSSLHPEEVTRLLDHYHVIGVRRARLLALAQDAARKDWWEAFASDISANYRQFISLEHEASSIAIWHSDLVPGLFQTAGYARHIISSYTQIEPVPPAMIERLVGIRLRRQQVLTYDDLQISVVLDESILQRLLGDEQMMHEQLQHLARQADLPNVTLRVFPLGAQHTVASESFTIFGFGGGEAMLQDVVCNESLRTGFHVEGEMETYLHGLAFQAHVDSSLDPAASRRLIVATAESRWPNSK